MLNILYFNSDFIIQTMLKEAFTKMGFDSSWILDHGGIKVPSWRR